MSNFEITPGAAYNPASNFDLVDSTGASLSTYGSSITSIDTPLLASNIYITAGQITSQVNYISNNSEIPISYDTGGVYLNLSSAGQGADIAATAFNSDLVGSKFNDMISGGAGVDTLTGGGGSDQFSDSPFFFHFGTVPPGQNLPENLDGDTITDFTSANGFSLVGFTPSAVSVAAGEISISGVQSGFFPDYAATLSVHTPGFTGPTVTVNGDTFIIDTGAASYTYSGGSNDVQIFGTSKPDTIVGGPDTGSIFGSGGDDTLRQGAGDSFLYGNVGNDHITLSSDISNSVAYGGKGDDVIDASLDSNITFLSGDLGNDTVLAGSGFGDVFGGDGDDVLKGDGGVYAFYGNAGNDTIIPDAGVIPNSGADVSTVYAGKGDDLVDARTSTADLQIHGDLGNDSILAGAGHETIWGGPGSDTITANAGGLDTIAVNLGDSTADSISGGANLDHVLNFTSAIGHGETTGVYLAFAGHPNGGSVNVAFDPAVEVNYNAAYAYAYGDAANHVAGHLGGPIVYVVTSDAADHAYVFTTDAAVELDGSGNAAPSLFAGDILGLPAS